jgi:hypothetical protein
MYREQEMGPLWVLTHDRAYVYVSSRQHFGVLAKVLPRTTPRVFPCLAILQLRSRLPSLDVVLAGHWCIGHDDSRLTAESAPAIPCVLLRTTCQGLCSSQSTTGALHQQRRFLDRVLCSESLDVLYLPGYHGSHANFGTCPNQVRSSICTRSRIPLVRFESVVQL